VTRNEDDVIYLDTSFVAPLFLPEETSSEVVAYVRALPANDVAVSNWTMVEFSSLLARKVRTAELSADEAKRADARFEDAVGGSLVVTLANGDDFSVARRYVQRLETGLRAPDALHLAIAANRDARTILSLDKKLVAAGKILGLPVSQGIELD
jgi:predicted nucleic acid-binding protein